MKFDLSLPDLSSSAADEGIKNYLALLNEQLVFMMSNIDSENLSSDLSDTVSEAAKNTERIERIEKTVRDDEGRIASFEMSSRRINWMVKGDSESTFDLTESAAELISGLIDVTGFVRFSDLSGSGTTTINGANLTTGSVAADKLNVGELASLRATLGGFDIDSDSISSDATDGTSITLSSARSGTNYWLRAVNDLGNTTFAIYKSGDCLFNGDFIVNGTVTAEKIRADSDSLLDLRGDYGGMRIGKSLQLSNGTDQKRIFLNLRGDLVFETGGNAGFTLKLNRTGSVYRFTLCDAAGNEIGAIPVGS